MDEDPSQPVQPDEPRSSDAGARPEELEERAAAAADATWGESEGNRARVPGMLSGDIGPKGRIGAQLRELSRHERATYGEVPRGTVVSGGGRHILVLMFVIAFVLLALVVLLGWVVSR
jgi:hypothetical protein